MIGAPMGGLDLAAGAMSQAIGDIFRGQNEAIAARPDTFAKAEDLAASQQKRAMGMAQFPLDIARSQQQLKLGEMQLQMQPVELKRLQQLTGYEEMKQGWEKADRSTLESARTNAMVWRQSVLDDPKADPKLKTYLGAASSPDAVMALAQRYETQQQQVEMENLKAQHQMLLKQYELSHQKLGIENIIGEAYQNEINAGKSPQEAANAIKAHPAVNLYRDMHGLGYKEALDQARMLHLKALVDQVDMRGQLYDVRKQLLDAQIDKLGNAPKENWIKSQIEELRDQNKFLQNLAVQHGMTKEIQAQLNLNSRRMAEIRKDMPGAPPTKPALTAEQILGKYFPTTGAK